MSDEKSIRVTVLEVKHWAKTLLSFKVNRPDGFKFTAGQFVRLGIHTAHQSPNQVMLAQDDSQPASQTNSQLDSQPTVFRAYSVVSSPYDEFIEFFSVVIPDGAFTSQIKNVQVGDTLLLNPTPFGYLTLARYQLPLPKDLWLLATGTGLAPFLSILKTLDVWEQYQRIILVYSARTYEELAYQAEINDLKANYGAEGAAFVFIPIVTREPDFIGLNERMPALITSGKLEAAAQQPFDKNSSHVMLCGNPQMVEDTKEALKSLGLTMNRRGEGNIAVENYW